MPAGVQWTMGYSSSDISSVSVAAGSSSTAAGKSVNCSSTSTSTICVAYGMNENIIASGTVASATITIASGALDTSAPIQISGVMATDLTGSTSIATSGTGGIITIPQPTQPTLSGLSCAPATVNAGGVSACTVTLSSAALAGGFVVGVTSNNANATVPASVTVAAGAASVGFSATASATVPSAQTAVLTASAAGVSKTFSLSLLAGTWTISGSVGTAGSGATIALTGASTATTTANASGAYTFTGLANGSYTVTPSLSGHTFSPTSEAVTVSGANVTAATFTATTQTWNISGAVGTAGSGATIALTGTSTVTATADASGNYTFSGLANGSYTVTPTKTGYTFSPASVAVTVNSANVTAATFTATQQTWTISGLVGTAGSSATIALTGASTATTTASASGAYTFTGLANGSYTVTPTKSGYTFSPTSAAVTVNGANVTVPNFTATAQTWTISGSVGTTGSGATIALTGASTATTTASASGAYTFAGLANGSYTVTPTKSGATFSPASVGVTVSGANATAATFTATLQTWTISGSVGTSGSGATIALTGASTATTTANAAGAYSFTGLANGSYTVTPSLSGYTFSPTSAAVSVNGANVTAATFTATQQTWTISGSVGTSGSGATIALTGASTASTTANASGAYTFTALANGSYTITPSLSGHTFSPASVAVTVSGANVTAATFTATTQTWTISGSVGSAGSGATIALTGASTATTTANASGAYTFTGLVNGSYTITPSLTGYSFSPASVAVTVNGANVTAAAITATHQTWTISGSVGSAGSGATIALTGASTATTTANASGAYTFTGLANGSYTITPSLTGYTFSPASVAVTISGANVTAATFTLSVNPTSITIDATVSADRSTSSNSIATSALSTVSNNELLLALIATGAKTAQKGISAHVTVAGVTGGGLTWVLVNRTDVQTGTAEVWRTFAPTPLQSVSITATLSASAPASMTVMSFAGVNTTGTNGSGAVGATASANASSGAPGATLATTQNNSWVLGVGTDTRKASARTVGPNQTMVHQYLTSTTDTYWVQRMSGATAASGSTVTINDSAPTGDPYNLNIVEILAAQSVGSQITGLVTPQAVIAAKTNSPSNSVAPGASPVLATITTGQAAEACSPGGLASLLGAGLTAAPTEKSSSVPLPTQLAGVQVMVNGTPAPLLFASSSQINFQCPELPRGTAMQIQVESPGGALMPTLQTAMQAAVPLVFQMDASGRGVVTIDGTNEIAMATTDGVASRPALPGEYLTIHASGLGEVVDGVAAGAAAPLNRLVLAKAKISVMLGGIEIDPQFAGLAPGTVGVYQVNALVPTEAAAGTAIPLYLKATLADGSIVQSNTVTVAIGNGTK